MFALSVFLLFIHVLHHIVQCWSVWCGDVLQRCILSGAKMCTEVVRPRVCCQDYQHQEAVGERWVDTIWVLTGTSSGKRQHVSKVPVLTVLYRPTKDTEAFYCIYFVLGLDMQTKKCWVQDLPQENCSSTETPPFRHAKSEVMRSHCVCTFVRLRVLISTCFFSSSGRWRPANCYCRRCK